jgi:hypothetical protein
MPRKPKPEKQTITVVVNGNPVAVILHPPTGTRPSWYAYWNGLVASKSTGQRNLADAILAAENMVKGGGRRVTVAEAVLSDEEFEALQRAHFARKTDPAAKVRAATTLEECLDAISAFQSITGLGRIAAATPDDCARFQAQGLTRPKNWRKQHPRSKKTEERVSPNTVLKWSRMLQAAFERANRRAGKKCIRGVVEEAKLLSANPWTQFPWIEGTSSPIRQFDGEELLALLGYLETTWAAVPVAALAAKLFLWSCCRKLEVAGLTWGSLRLVGPRDDPAEAHFEVVGKWGVERWFRVPLSLYRELKAVEEEGSAYVLAAYTRQVSQAHADNPGCLKKIRGEYVPRNFGRWFYERVKEWSAGHPKGRAFVHHFRKTGLQHARRGEDINREVAADARVGESVLMTSYVKETDEELRARSNRTYRRLLASLAGEVARRYGHAEAGPSRLERQLQEAMAAKDWPLVRELSARLERQTCPGVG